jgi:uncharacterized protein YndB with AHSA1/START domain
MKPAFDLVLSRIIHAPRNRVFKARSEPEQVAQWFGPKGFTVPICDMDFRPGGTFRLTMRGPDGIDYPFSGTYRQINPSKRLVWNGEFPGGPRDQVRTEITFEEEGGKTRLTVRQTFAVVTPADEPKTKGAKQGWTETLDRLAAYSEGLRTQHSR